nr:hypothetical protein [Sphingomonas sp.]
MDLNYLFLRQQVERSRADAAGDAAARAAHEEMARRYELEIEQSSGGRIAFSWNSNEAPADAGSDQLISANSTQSASS